MEGERRDVRDGGSRGGGGGWWEVTLVFLFFSLDEVKFD